MNQSTVEANWNPKRWVAVILSFLVAPIGMLYLGRKWLAMMYLTIILTLLSIWLLYFSSYSPLDFSYLLKVIPLIALAHAYWLSPRVNEPRKWFSRWYALLSIFLIFMIPLVIFRVFIVETFKIPSTSMLPTLQVGQLIHVNKWGCGNYKFLGFLIYQSDASETCQINRGDLIVFEFPLDPEQIYIKRVMAVAGDHVNYVNKNVLINDEPIQSEWLKNEGGNDYFQESVNGTSYQVIKKKGVHHTFRNTNIYVAEGSLYVMGDNRDNSADSRSWGVIPIENVVGKLILD